MKKFNQNVARCLCICPFLLLLKKIIQTLRDGEHLDFIVVTLMISYFQINSQMLRSLVFTGVNPRISIESEEFGTNNYHKDSSFSFLNLSILIELGDQHDCGCIVRNETIGNSW